MRQLIYIPTVHDPAEMHNPDFFSELMSGSGFNLHAAVWRSILSSTPSLGEDLTGVKLYGESISADFPPSGTVAPLSETLPLVATATEKQVELTYALHKAGAQIMATEDEQIFDDMLRISQTQIRILNGMRSKQIDPAIGKSEIGTLNQFWRIYMQLRDQAIARNIDQSLGSGERGILLLGMGHDVKPYLPDDIDFKFLSEMLEMRWEVSKEREDPSHLPDNSSPLRSRL